MMKKFILILVLFGLSACENHHTDKRTDEKNPQLGSGEFGNSSAAMDTAVVTHRAVIATNKGTFIVDLFGEDAPRTVENFTKLAKSGFYNHILFHRVARDFIIQAGDPNTKSNSKRKIWGNSGKSIFGDTFEDELNPTKPSYRRGYQRGTFAMANRGTNTNTSQFFICLRDEPELPKNYTIFGRISDGMNVVSAIGGVAVQPLVSDNDGVPIKPVMIKSIVVKKLGEGTHTKSKNSPEISDSTKTDSTIKQQTKNLETNKSQSQ